MSSASWLAGLGHRASHLHIGTSDPSGDVSQSLGGTNILKHEDYFWATVLPSPSKAMKNTTILEEDRQGHAKSVHLPQVGQSEIKGS